MAKKKKEYLYDWCIKNNRQDLLDSLEKAGVDFEIIKTKITYGSKEKLHWYCPECKKLYDILIKDNPNIPKFYIQEYQVQNKTRSKKHCRICNHGSNTVISGVNDFITRCKLNKDKYGHLIEEWHPDNIVKPNKIALNYTKKVYWKCPKCGYGTNKEWNEEYNSKVIAKNGKPLTKDNITFGSGNEVYWICSDPKCKYGKNGEWKTPLKRRTISGIGCRACAGKVVEKGKNDIATTHPEIAKQWDDEKNLKEFGITKYEVSKGSHLFAYWKCDKDKGHPPYQVIVNDKTDKNSCPLCRNWKTNLETYCNNKENQKKYKEKFGRELKSILDDWHPDNKIKPKDIRHSDDKEQILWKCPICKRKYLSTVRKKLKSETGACNECAAKQRKLTQRANLPMEKTLAFKNPEFVKDWHPEPQKNYIKELNLYLTPENTALGNHIDKIWWKCHICGYEWQKDVRYRNQHQQKCPICKYNHKIIYINFKDREYEITKDLIVPYLSGKICHFTNFEAYKKIIEDGFIKTATDERCRGYIRKWVCMADFRNINTNKSSWQEITEIATKNNVIFVLEESAYGNIEEPVDFSFRETNKEEGWYIPYFECWYKGILRLDKIKTIYYVDKDESIKNMSIAIEKYLRSS